MAKIIPMPFLYPQTPFIFRIPATFPSVQPLVVSRHASGISLGVKRVNSKVVAKKRKARKEFKNHTLDESMQFSLCDAMRYSQSCPRCRSILMPNSYIKAFEVGRSPISIKYDLAIRLKTFKNGPVVRSRLRLPYPVGSSIRTCVICPPDSPIAEQAIKAGATMAGETAVFDAIKAGKLDFERCLCHPDSVDKLNKAGVARILGPKGLMPSPKQGTVTRDIAGTMRALIGGTEYREKIGVIRCAIGQLANTPEEMQANIKAFVEKIKEDISKLTDMIPKSIYEVVNIFTSDGTPFGLGDFANTL